VGRDLLVAPILEQGSEARAVYLPNDAWYDLWTDVRLTGGQHHLAPGRLEQIPVFVRGGAILPFLEEAKSSGMQDLSTVTLNVWPGVNEGFDWYEDDGLTQSHESGCWHRRRMRLQRQSRRIGLEIGASSGTYPSKVRTWRVILHDVHRTARVTLNGMPVDVLRFPEHRLLAVEVAATDAPVRIEFGPA
jgi:alpha-glucosidase (family GH31 glycosyl hydrolase)